MPIDTVQDLMKDRSDLVVLARESEVEATVEEGLKNGFITPGMRKWVTAFCPKIRIVLPSHSYDHPGICPSVQIFARRQARTGPHVSGI
ncbi:phage protease [Aliiroseovarius crassostreae]|uniref:hypothetical protein n=1 Tax=Aliiroseovarius crassostreae TaxID=154981 RepID=UPI0021FAA0D4|nr:phage protease [Aliiroseovarius crassostreae]UWQ11693.1 phage protease [Aliiroseovarius crassostreae]